MTPLEIDCDSYVLCTQGWVRGDAGMAFELSIDRQDIQDQFSDLDPERRGAVLAADQRLIEIARGETDRGIQADLWGALAYCGYPPEGPTRVD